MNSYAPTQAAPDLASRAAAVAAVHIDPINASRKRCGLPPLTAATLTREFSDIERLPLRTNLSRRDAANLAVLRQGIPADQAGIDNMWAGIAGKLNATLPSKRASTGARLASSEVADGRRDNAPIDWASIAAKLNAEAGLAAPTRSRAR